MENKLENNSEEKGKSRESEGVRDGEGKRGKK